MDRFHWLSVYQAVAEEQGFASGARRLGMSPPAVTRAVAALEDHLGVKLLHRTTRNVRVTEAGQRYLEDARRILEELEVADNAVVGANAEPRGELVVTAPVLFGRMFVTPGIVEYLRRYPQTQVSAMFVDRIVNVMEEGIDVGVRIGELPDSSMRALRVGTVRLVLVASPEYLRTHGIPVVPEMLQEHCIIASNAGNNAFDWRFSGPGSGQGKGEGKGQDQLLRIRPRLSVTTNDAAIAAAAAGFGVTRVLSYQVADQVASGELIILLPEYESAPRPVHIVHREGRNAPAKVRSFVDLMAERLRADKALNNEC